MVAGTRKVVQILLLKCFQPFPNQGTRRNSLVAVSLLSRSFPALRSTLPPDSYPYHYLNTELAKVASDALLPSSYTTEEQQLLTWLTFFFLELLSSLDFSCSMSLWGIRFSASFAGLCPAPPFSILEVLLCRAPFRLSSLAILHFPLRRSPVPLTSAPRGFQVPFYVLRIFFLSSGSIYITVD